MSKTIKTWRDPYGEGFSTCRPRNITINKGLTVLVGCNGAGKTTLLQNIKEQLRKENTPCFYFDNLHDGGSNSISAAFGKGNLAFAATAWTSSEGENISLNVRQIAADLKQFIEIGKSAKDIEHEKWKRMFNDDEDEEELISNERWLLLDAIDSGYSIDNIVDLKGLFNIVMEDAKRKNIDLYIIVVANEYELANGENCFDVNTGKYVTFEDYDDYKKFILASRKKKDKRYAKKEN